VNLILHCHRHFNNIYTTKHTTDTSIIIIVIVVVVVVVVLWSDRKRPNGLTLILREIGKALTWDVMVIFGLAELYMEAAAWDAGAVVEIAAAHKSNSC